MTPWQNRVTALTRRMAEDMQLRNYSQKTIDAYTYHVGRFAQFLGRSLEQATPEDVRSFQLHLINERKVGWSSFNQAVCGLRFLYRTTYPRDWAVSMVPFGRKPKTLPAVLSSDEVTRLLSCVKSLKHRTFLLTLYAAGLRLSEAAALTIADIDSQRMQLRIACGKGAKERLVPLSPRLLEALRHYWKEVRSPQYLFPGKTFEVPLSSTTIQKTCKAAVQNAGIRKAVTPHTLRHSSAKLLLPGVTYYQVVFTIPDRLSSLTLGNRQVMFDLLFHSAWQALKQTIEHEQQFEAAAAMVLHTWNQQLEAHVHVHAFVPGGGPSLKNPDEWKTARPPAQKTQNRFWLVDADDLRLAFRTAFLAGLRRLHARGKLLLDGEWLPLRDVAAFAGWLAPLEAVNWVTYIQPPPTQDTTPDQVLKYLARYLTGGPISDRRLVRHEHGHVTFRARTGTQTGGSDETEEVRLPGAEFVRRWTLHILPQGYTKTRRYGGYSNPHRQRYQAACRELLPPAGPVHDPAASADPGDAGPPEHRCPRCESLDIEAWLTRTSGTDRPGWGTVMSSPHRPSWYARASFARVRYDDG